MLVPETFASGDANRDANRDANADSPRQSRSMGQDVDQIRLLAGERILQAKAWQQLVHLVVP